MRDASSTSPQVRNYKTTPAHGIDPVDFELWCAGVSAINGCSACVDSHEKVVCEEGLSEQAVLAAIRLAAVIQGLVTVLDAEKVSSAQSVSP